MVFFPFRRRVWRFLGSLEKVKNSNKTYISFPKSAKNVITEKQLQDRAQNLNLTLVQSLYFKIELITKTIIVIYVIHISKGH